MGKTSCPCLSTHNTPGWPPPIMSIIQYALQRAYSRFQCRSNQLDTCPVGEAVRHYHARLLLEPNEATSSSAKPEVICTSMCSTTMVSTRQKLLPGSVSTQCFLIVSPVPNPVPCWANALGLLRSYVSTSRRGSAAPVSTRAARHAGVRTPALASDRRRALQAVTALPLLSAIRNAGGFSSEARKTSVWKEDECGFWSVSPVGAGCLLRTGAFSQAGGPRESFQPDDLL
jgi:hypothetical protein